MAGEETMTWCLDAICRHTGGRLLARGEERFRAISTDTRALMGGELFFALVGERYDGHTFLPQAWERGAAGAVVSQEPDTIPAGRSVILVPDTQRALGDLAHAHRRSFEGPLIAVTGSSGKTTTKEMLAAILGRVAPTLASEKSFNNFVGVPLTLFQMRPNHRFVVLEFGMNAPGEIERLTEIAEPTIGVITNIGHAHVGFLGSIEGVARAKGELWKGMAQGTIVVNHDDAQVVNLAADRHLTHLSRITFGMEHPADITAKGIEERGFEGFSFTLEIRPATFQARIDLHLLGRQNIANALSAAATAMAAGVAPEAIAEGLCTCRPPKGRMVPIRLPGGIHIIDDTYNANPESVRHAVETVAALPMPGRKFVLLGDMFELGEHAAALHYEVGSAIARAGIDHLAAIGSFASDLLAGACSAGAQDTHTFPDHDAAAEWLWDRLRPGDLLLVKGSRGMRMERVISRFTGED
ncbi:MAG: UDP-N-acetylmuramoyl-tripeptide--D-alanyl-D-alanine ligase [Deltaproteobacteria bacterium]|nr:MAG: UDP-N-acetylmuramoyl-tripeptide--D-alanyl-D-alanine ligase [Deltaproteobacteria bacterium]